MVGVAQMVRAPDCDSGGRGFDSHHPPQFFRKRRKGAFCFSVYSAREKPEQCSGFLCWMVFNLARHFSARQS